MKILRPRTRVGCAVALATATLTGCVSDPTPAADDPTTTTQVAQADDVTDAVKDGGDWIGVFGNYGTAISLVLSMFGDTPEDRLHDDLMTLYNGLVTIEQEIRDAGGEILSSQMQNDLSDTGSDSAAARREFLLNGTVSAIDASNYLADSFRTTQRLKNNSEYWNRLFVDKVTFGEWRSITAFRPPITDGKVWDYRWALPALMEAIPIRMSTMLAADPVDFKTTDLYKTELEGYRDKLVDTMTQIESHVACNFQIAADIRGPYIASNITYHVHAICGDPFTGREVTFVTDKTDPRPDEVAYYSKYYGSFTIWDPDSQWAYPTYSTVGAIRSRFWTILNEDPFLQNWMNDSLVNARAQLRTKLGLFEIRREIDGLNTVINRDPGPVSGGRVRAALAGLCLSRDLSLSGGLSYTRTATCDTPTTHTWGQTWKFDATTASFRSVDTNECLALLGRPADPMQWTIVTTCNPNDEAQRWSYDPTSHRIRNAQTFVLDIYNGNTTPGGYVWTYWDTGNAAQQWGFPSPYTVHGGIGGL